MLLRTCAILASPGSLSTYSQKTVIEIVEDLVSPNSYPPHLNYFSAHPPPLCAPGGKVGRVQPFSFCPLPYFLSSSLLYRTGFEWRRNARLRRNSTLANPQDARTFARIARLGPCVSSFSFFFLFFFLKNSFREKWIQDISKMGNFAGRRLNYNCDTGQLRNT